ncbi:MAG: DUF368 domain-containing protein [Firmicutes bacterium]|nr:DUF368 domain-containing protein [Bacillota bacterium]MBQ4091976.1 DUF368 domain-containing protein [Bacillota bacterium]
MIKLILQGIAVGVANIIPGVSGGTMMVAMGLYDKLIHAITHLKSEFKESLKLLIPIFIGVGIALVALARIIEFCLVHYPLPTNFAFCGLIAGSLPFIFQKVKGAKINISRGLSFLVFFAVVVGLALIGNASGEDANVSLSIISIVKLFFVGVVAAATMVVPGVSGSMMLMLMGYYDVLLATVNDFVDGLVTMDMSLLLGACGVLVPAGIGVVVGIFVIAKIIEFIFQKAETCAYFAIIGLIMASPIAILLNTDWSGISVLSMAVSAVTFAIGWFIAGKLGGE